MSVAARRVRRRPALSAPEAGAVLAGLAIALISAVTALRITTVVLDENVYKLAAVQYADGLLGGIANDNTSRGIARLYSVVITPVFWLFDGDVAVRLARALNGVFFASTALPVFALARRAGADRRLACAAAVLTVAVPWLTLSTILFSESLAYLLFACTLLAMVRLLEAPGHVREGVVLALLAALVLTRVQFAGVGAGWVIFLAVTERRAGRRPWKRFPLTFGLAALALIVTLARPKSLAGPYYGITQRGEVPGNFAIGALWEVEMLALGVGVVPALLAAAWWPDALRGRRGAGAARVGLVAVVTLAFLWAGTLWAQGGWLDYSSEERYFIYTVPLLWIGAVLAIGDGTLPWRRIAWLGLALAAIVATVPVQVSATGEQLFLGPVSGVLADALPDVTRSLSDLVGTKGLISPRDLLGLLVLALAAGVALAWARGRRAAVLVPAIVLQLAFAAYAFAGLDGGFGFSGITGGQAFGGLGWVDRASGGAGDAVLLDNQTADRPRLQRDTLFWNDDVDALYRLPDLGQPVPEFPLFTIPTVAAQAGDDLTVTAPFNGEQVVTATDSPLWQPADPKVVDRSPDGRLQLAGVPDPRRLQWLARGLDFDGQVTRDTVLLAAPGRRVTLELVAPETAQPASVDVRLGGERVRFDAQRTKRRVIEVDLCDRYAPVRGAITLRQGGDVGGGRFSGALLRSVAVERC